jgi:hypothetical protein
LLSELFFYADKSSVLVSVLLEDNFAPYVLKYLFSYDAEDSPALLWWHFTPSD